MSEEDSPNNEPIIKGKQETQRKFGCPCGKWYLSYPALFTHVKQKHQGKPPGALIKPKTDKARGRPRLPTSTIDEDQSTLNYDCVYELQKALLNKAIDYNEVFEVSEGTQTCQDMASQFHKLIDYDCEQKKIINCFLNYIRFFVKKRYEQRYWETHKPTDIIDISNQIVRDLDNNKEAFPIDKPTLIDLLYIMFRWMYKNKWTDHKLIRRTAENMQQQQMQLLMQMQQYHLQQQQQEKGQKLNKLERVKNQKQVNHQGKDIQVKDQQENMKQEKAEENQIQNQQKLVIKKQELD